MKVAITFLALLLPAQAWAQLVDLTLNCQYESSNEPMKAGSETPATGSFSAIVRMNEVPRVARIETATLGCLVYVGGFDEQEVAGDCERVAGGTKIKATLTINRINGEFSHTTSIGQSYMIYSGHCAVARRRLAESNRCDAGKVRPSMFTAIAGAPLQQRHVPKNRPRL